jgi:D-beta-D-heptose 7-phosphate kinase/D-beta-D-heptose 1-phosphate adenosyltransferase
LALEPAAAYKPGMDFSDLSILCIGDVMLDRFQHGDIDRISPEAPVPVIRLRQVREMPGGAGNVACNIASLGGRAILIGVAGQDVAAEQMSRKLEAHGRVTDAVVRSPRRPTICKTRFIAGRQQVVRADDESGEALHQDEVAALCAAIDMHLPQAKALILSDYGKGVLCAAVLARAIGAARAAGIPVFVDPKSDDFARYRGATCITPNSKEFSIAARSPAATEAEIAAGAERLIEQADAQALLITRSEKGMTLVERGGTVTSVPALAREVFDVSGAGDTVIATLALAHASGRTLVQAMHIANAAAGVVVSKLGTATVNIAEVMHELAAQSGEQEGPAVAGLQSLAAAQALVTHWRDQGLEVGFTNGCFDILHPGHVSLLAFSRRNCDRLVVALNTDDSVRRLKGPTRPVNGLEQRAQVMAAIRFVDCVVGFDQDTPLEMIKALLPDVLIKGADYAVSQVVGADVVQAAGGRVILADLVAGQSTTNIISRAKSGEVLA